MVERQVYANLRQNRQRPATADATIDPARGNKMPNTFHLQ